MHQWIIPSYKCLSYSCSTVYLVQQPDVRYSSSRLMANENTVPYIRVLHWIYSSTMGLYSDWSVCSCQNLWWTCQNFAVLKSRDQNPCSQTLIAGNRCSLGVQNERLEYTRLFVCGRWNRGFNIITGMWNNRKWELRGVKRIKEEWPKESRIIRQLAIIVNLQRGGILTNISCTQARGIFGG